MRENDKLTIGILAHVDAGKTTLSEAILYRCGAIRKQGRVDHKNAFMDTDAQEKQRGITIFSGQACFDMPQSKARITLLDTPGHVDFSAEMERTLGVLDYAVLVISGKEGVQGHTITLWNLLERYNVPVFFFVNKMDMEGTDRNRILRDIRRSFGTGCIDFAEDTADAEEWKEEAALCHEELMEEYLADGSMSAETMARAIKARQIFPCFFGSALKNRGVDSLLEGLEKYALGFSQGDIKEYENQETLLRVFRITRDDRGERLTHVKILRGILRARDTVNGEKVNQIRIYSGSRFHTEDVVGPGTICCLTGPDSTKIGQITGDRVLDRCMSLGEAVMSYSLILPGEMNVQEAYASMKQLEEEDPQLRITWNEKDGEIQLNLMGQVQLEIVRNVIKSRFGIDAEFGPGRIAYKETITEPVEGAGHYEPLRHYAEVHLLLEPLPAGSGLVFSSPVSSDELDTNWQRLIMTHLKEKEHIGTLTGSPITDMKISVVAGKAHEKHTEGGDFRQATYRALRQGLRKALRAKAMQLLEPWYEYRLEIPQEMVGRAMSDIQRMGGIFNAPETAGAEPGGTGGDLIVITGEAPVSELKDYFTDVASYTKGYGHLICSPAGYRPCHNRDDVVAERAYDPDRDTDNTADSVFCSHGAGHSVAWDKSDEMMHALRRAVKAESGGTVDFADDMELDRIFERTYGAKAEKHKTIEARQFDSELERRKREAENRRRAKEAEKRRAFAELPEYLLVDGYNIIFAWEELKDLAKANLDAAREALVEILGNYQGYRRCSIIAVFDAYKVKGGRRHFEKQSGITVVYTGEAETADSFIERTTYELSGRPDAYRVRVATSDRLEQMIIMGNNAMRVSAMDFRKEVEQAEEEISRTIMEISRRNRIENPNRMEFPSENEENNGGK